MICKLKGLIKSEKRKMKIILFIAWKLTFRGKIDQFPNIPRGDPK